jgi:transcription initiation factor TFIIE subunit alpha
MVLLTGIREELLLKVTNILGGEEAIVVVKYLASKDRVTDDEIATATGVKLNVVRKILYKLYDSSLITNERLRDEKTGWFIFWWSLQMGQLEGFVKNRKRECLEKLRIRFEYEKKHDFYYCNNPTCKEITFEEAMEVVFRCPSCGRPLQHFDNSSLIRVLSERIETLQKELNE